MSGTQSVAGKLFRRAYAMSWERRVKRMGHTGTVLCVGHGKGRRGGGGEGKGKKRRGGRRRAGDGGAGVMMVGGKR